MGMFDSFLGKGGGGYTEAQRSGLAQSAEIKKRRKEEERAFEREKIKAESKRALTERGTIEVGETRRTGMREAGQTKRQRLADIGTAARQKLTGERGVEAATVKARREAETASIEHGRKLSLAEIRAKGERRDLKIFTDPVTDEMGTLDPRTGKTRRLTLPPYTTPGETARNSLGKTKEKEKEPPWNIFDY